MAHPDVVIVGGGVVGAACAHHLAAAGLRVELLDRGAPASATTASGEGNVLVSDKVPGPELDLALASRAAWPGLLAAVREELGPRRAEIEWDPKGGLVVTTGDPASLHRLAADQRAVGVDAVMVTPENARALEPGLGPAITGAVHHPQDAQVQPVLAAAALLAAARSRGAVVRAGVAVHGVTTAGGRVRGVRVGATDIPCGAVVNACGPWSGEFARAAGAPIAIAARRGMVLVTAAGPSVRHKVYDAGYLDTVASGDAALQTSAVVESTRAGTLLIGSSRERIGFDATIRARVLRELARNALRLFPGLAGVPVIRAYGGFRPYAPDHLPVIGEDPRLPGLWHATGHEGAGIGLAPATGRLLTELFTGGTPHLDPAPFRVDRAAILGVAA